MAHELEGDFGDFKESVKGIVFMGTPHLGAEIAAATKFLRNAFNIITIWGVLGNLLKDLEPGSRELQLVSQQFVNRGQELLIVSMYEQKLTKRILVSCARQSFVPPPPD